MTFNFGSRKNNYLHKKPHDIFFRKKKVTLKKIQLEQKSPGTKSHLTFFQGKKSPKNVTWKKIMQLFFLEERVT